MDSAIPVVKMGAFNPACSAGVDPMASSNFFGSCYLYNICTHIPTGFFVGFSL